MCDICEKTSALQWTDTHGVAACSDCGSPYKVIHRDENGKVIDKEPESLTLEKWVPILKRYLKETSHKIPHGYDLPGSYYSGVVREDYLAFNKWCEDNKEIIPHD